MYIHSIWQLCNGVKPTPLGFFMTSEEGQKGLPPGSPFINFYEIGVFTRTIASGGFAGCLFVHRKRIRHIDDAVPVHIRKRRLRTVRLVFT